MWYIICGGLFLLTYFGQDILYEEIWLYSMLLLLLFAIAFIAVFTLALAKKDMRVIPVLIIILTIISINEILTSEILKSEKVLQAILHDDRSAINLTLRKNATFEVNSVTMFSQQNFKGKYKLQRDKIIFLNKPYDNNLIPDTVTIVNNRIILKFNDDNQPVTDFATYFDITQNELANRP